MNITERINKELELLKNNLIQHRLYDCLKTVKDVKTFTEYHMLKQQSICSFRNYRMENKKKNNSRSM